uniref:RagB/SusD family nutrient uptake outer membrane protein n=1 Tax=Alloprevotella sp. TaxID=1872471 RepID=UPI0040295E2E
MKYSIFTCCLLAASLTAASCSDFLTEDPKGQLTPETFFKTQSDLDQSVDALYSLVQDLQCNSNSMIVKCQGDDVTSTTGSNKAAYLSADAFETPTDTKGISRTWSAMYSIVKAANLIIENASKVSTTQDEINIALGQAYYWRAYAYFELVRVFGPVPINLNNDASNTKASPNSVEEVYNQIVKDLTAAEQCNLPAKYTVSKRSIDGQNIWVSAQAVKATLAAVYLNMAGYPLNKTENYALAAAKAKEVIDGVEAGTYDQALLADWNKVYSYGMNHHNETILGIDYNSTPGGWSNQDSQISSCHQFTTINGGWGDFLAERHFWKNFPDGARKDAVYAKQIYVSGNTVDWWATTDGEAYTKNEDGTTNAVISDFRPMFVGFTVNDNVGSPAVADYDYTKPFWGGMCVNKRHQLIRYSEVLCWYAEAAARAGQDLAAAKAALKQVRARAYADQTKVAEVDAMSADQLAEAAYTEHGYEVAGNVLGMVTRRDDEFRMNRLKEAHDFRAGEQDEVLVPAGTLTHSVDAQGNPFTYTLKADVKMKENMPVTVAWKDAESIYHIYPPTEVEQNPNLKR